MCTCPWCGSDSHTSHLNLKDLFLTQESFEIVECQSCHLLYTVPRPAPDKIGDYYKSDEYYSHQENKHGFIPRVYESVKRVNLKNKVSMTFDSISQSSGSICDYGCGVGDFLKQVKSLYPNWNIKAVEPSPDAQTIVHDRLGFFPYSLNQLDLLGDDEFDIFTMWHVFEHVDDIRSHVALLSRCIKPNGRLVIAVPNFLSFDAQFYKEYWAAYDVPRHLNHFCPDSIRAIFSETQFELTDIQPLKWDSYYISFLSEKYLHHSVPLLRGVCRGFQSNNRAHQSGNYSSLVYIFKHNKS